MANNHTPGPWRYARAGRIMATIDGREHSVASVHLNEGISAMDSFANARLIAAAPDLLAALEDAEFLLRKAGQLSGPMQDSFTRSAADARAAIAKARGEMQS